MRFSRLALIILFHLFAVSARASWLCNPAEEQCWYWKRSNSSSPAYPSTSSSIKINPSAVPTEDQFGVETLFFNNQWDFAVVKGTGRIGAAISPTNGEDSFFGPPGFELAPDQLKRKIDQQKFKSQKINLATAFNLYKNKKQGLRRFELNLGVGAKYNRFTKSVLPGGGVRGVFGPFTFGYAMGTEDCQLDYTPYGIELKEEFSHTTDTVSVGMYLNSLAIDYSFMRLFVPGHDTMEVSLITGSLLLKRWILTLAHRTERSDRLAFDPVTQTLFVQPLKVDMFGGVQFSATKNIMLGVFYNYYLLNDLTLGLTVFF